MPFTLAAIDSSRGLQFASDASMRFAVLAAFVASVTSRSIAHAGAFVMPPIELDLGASTTLPAGPGPATADQRRTVGTTAGPGKAHKAQLEMLLGVSWVSLAWVPTDLDLGLGYVETFRAPTPSNQSFAPERTTMPANDPGGLALKGGYLSVGHTLFDRSHIRSWVTLRGEVLRAELDDRVWVTMGAAIRLTVEAYQWDAWTKSCSCGIGVRSGSIALGVYVEMSHRSLATELGPDAVTVGIALHMPLVAVAGGGGR